MLKDIMIPSILLGGLGLVFGVLLAYASKKFSVKRDERIDTIRAELPGANCGACGKSGCDGFAEALVKGEVKVDGCPVGGTAVAAKLGEIMGVEIKPQVDKIARVMCNGSDDKAKKKYDYAGIKDCASAAVLYGGDQACSYGCLGLGSCVKACQFGAIIIENGIARIVDSKCTGCKKCVSACPKNIIRMVPAASGVTVYCSSRDKGAVVRQNCEVGCIGCKKCSKVCPEDAISFDGTLAIIDPAKCNNCGQCIRECPTGAISSRSCFDFQKSHRQVV